MPSQLSFLVVFKEVVGGGSFCYPGEFCNLLSEQLSLKFNAFPILVYFYVGSFIFFAILLNLFLVDGPYPIDFLFSCF